MSRKCVCWGWEWLFLFIFIFSHSTFRSFVRSLSLLLFFFIDFFHSNEMVSCTYWRRWNKISKNIYPNTIQVTWDINEDEYVLDVDLSAMNFSHVYLYTEYRMSIEWPSVMSTRSMRSTNEKIFEIYCDWLRISSIMNT